MTSILVVNDNPIFLRTARQARVLGGAASNRRSATEPEQRSTPGAGPLGWKPRRRQGKR